MRKLVLTIALVVGFAAVASAAPAKRSNGPTKLTKAEMALVTAGHSWNGAKNDGGNKPPGQFPPGQNK